MPGLVTRQRRRLAALLVAAALLAACNGGDGDDAPPTTTSTDSSTATTTERATTSTTQPAATDLGAVEPFIVDLLRRRDEIAAQIEQDPTVISDPDGLLSRYEELFAPDSPQVAEFRTSVEQGAADGLASRPGPSGVLEQTTLDDLFLGDSPDVVMFSVCAYSDYELYEVDTGNVVTAEARRVLTSGEARRIGGVWKLFDLHDPDPNLVTSLAPGTANPCLVEE